jgi:hypothetical protein
MVWFLTMQVLELPVVTAETLRRKEICRMVLKKGILWNSDGYRLLNGNKILNTTTQFTQCGCVNC